MADTSLDKHTAASDSAAVEAVSHHAVVRYNPDAPSEEWGWHGSWREFAPRGSNILIGLGVILLFLLNFSVHVSHVENYYFNGLALIGALYLVWRIRSGRKLRRQSSHQNAGN